MRRFVAVAALLLGACSIKPPLEVPSENILMVNSRGKIVDPTGNVRCAGARDRVCNGSHSGMRLYRELSNTESYEYVERVKDEIDAYGQTHPRRILIYIHGGLNSPYGSINRAVQLSDGILEANSYPIFINWQSSLMSSYWEHVWYVRQGEH